jgi:hypothetical protein
LGRRGRLDSSTLGEDQAAAGNDVGAPTWCQQGGGDVIEPPVWRAEPVNTLDILSLDIEQRVVSCFNDIAKHSSYSEVVHSSPFSALLLQLHQWVCHDVNPVRQSFNFLGGGTEYRHRHAV